MRPFGLSENVRDSHSSGSPSAAYPNQAPVRSRPPYRRSSVSAGARIAAQINRLLPADMFRCTLVAMTTASPDLDLDDLIADTEGEIVRLVRDRDPSTHGLYEMVRYHLALDGKGANGGKRVRPAARPAGLCLDRRRPQQGTPRRGSGRARSQLQPRPRRHRGRRHGAPPSTHAVVDPRHPAGDQRGRHAVQPVADRAPSTDRSRLLGRQGHPADASVR